MGLRWAICEPLPYLAIDGSTRVPLTIEPWNTRDNSYGKWMKMVVFFPKIHRLGIESNVQNGTKICFPGNVLFIDPGFQPHLPELANKWQDLWQT